MALQLNFKTIVLQSNVKVMVDCINRLEVCVNIELVIVDCKSLMKKFGCVPVMFLKRFYDVDAHNLVGIGRRLGCET